MGRDEKGPFAYLEDDFKEVPGIKAQNGSAVRGYVSDSVQTFIKLIEGLKIGHQDQVVELSGLSVPFVNTANFSGEEESGRPATGLRNAFFNPFFQIGFQPVQAVFRLDQFFLKL